MDLTQFLTDFADQAVVLPLAAWVAVGLFMMGWRRGALVWTCSVVGVLGVMLVLKLFFAACQSLVPFIVFHSPSGHTAAAAMIYGGLAALFLKDTRGGAVAVAAGAVYAVVIGATRLELGVHNLAEVVIGTLVGLAGVTALVGLAGPAPAQLRWARLIGAGLLLVTVFHGVHLGAEPLIDQFALLYFWPFSACRT